MPVTKSDLDADPEYPSPELYDENVAAIRAAIQDMHRDDLGRTATIVSDELRREFARPNNE
jgi:hypothetical protein